MSIRVGLYDFFAYTVPGVFYLLIGGFAASLFGLLSLTWQTINSLSFTALILLTGAGFVTGYIMDFFADKFADRFRSKGTARAALQQFKSFHPWIEVNFAADDWGILMQSLKQMHPDAAADLEQMNATSMMLRNLSLGFVLLAVVLVLYFFLVSNVVGNIVLALVCIVVAMVAMRVSTKFRGWFYLGIYSATAARTLKDYEWMQDGRGIVDTEQVPTRSSESTRPAQVSVA